MKACVLPGNFFGGHRRSARSRTPPRRGMVFTFDALLGSLLLLAALIIILHQYPSSTSISQSEHYAQDALLALNAIPVGDLADPWVQTRIADGTIEDPSIPVLEQIGAFWATNMTSEAKNLSLIALDGLLPSDIGFSLKAGGDEVLARPGPADPDRVVVGRRMLTGIAKGKALEGSTSAAYLKRIESKRSFAVTYFGGFVGQGNITVDLGPLPATFSAADVTGVTLQLDTIADFDLSINGAFCRTLTSNNDLMEVQSWDLSSCNASFVPGMNNITLVAKGELADSYVAGGYLKVGYTTNAFQEDEYETTKRYDFPVIDGIINLYDSVYAPGVVTDWYLNLSFFSNYTVYLRLGNETVFSSPGSNGTQNVVLEAHNLSWAPTTIPLRLGTTNFTNVTFVQSGQPADTALVTDVSGSMNDCGEWYTGPTCKYKCSWWFFWFWEQCVYPGSCGNEECGDCGAGWTDNSYSTPVDTICNRTKLEVAQAADKTAVDIILNTSGNQMGLVSYNDQVKNVMDLTTDSAALKTQIDGYTANSGTCICCGINRAKNMVKTSSNKRFMIVMSDGDANYRCDNFDDYTGTYDTTNAPQSTIDAGQNACDNYNITVFTIGFGDAMSEQGKSTLQQTACNASLYYDAANVSDLEEIYKNISQQILLIANFTAQTLIINGTYVNSHLYPGSYLDLNYTPLADPPHQNEILVKAETPQFANCTTTLDVPSAVRIADAVSTSYSGPYWTALLQVNGSDVFNLSQYSTDYVTVGDPFLVQIPSSLLGTSNAIHLVVADNNLTEKNCSDNNTIFYDAYVDSTVPRSDVLSKAEGCNWEIEFEDGHFMNVSIPSLYAGAKNCSYTNASRVYDPEDAYDYGVYNLLHDLDFDDDGRVYVNIRSEDLEIIVTVVQRVPYLWGPTLATLEVWR